MLVVSSCNAVKKSSPSCFLFSASWFTSTSIFCLTLKAIKRLSSPLILLPAHFPVFLSTNFCPSAEEYIVNLVAHLNSKFN